MTASWQESDDKPRQCVEKQRHYSANKDLYSQGYGLPSGHVWLWELDHKHGRAPKNWCLWNVVLEKTLKVPWTTRRSNQSILKEIFLEYSLEGLMLKLKLQSPDSNSQFNGKVPDAGKDWGQKRESEDEMAGWYRQCSGHDLGQTLGDGEAWHAAVHGVTEWDMTEQLNNNWHFSYAFYLIFLVIALGIKISILNFPQSTFRVRTVSSHEM